MTSILQSRKQLTSLQIFGEPHLHTDGELLALTFGPKGDLLTLEDPGILRRWNAATGQQTEWYALSDLEMLWSFSPDARVLASASDDLTVWDTSSGQSLTSVPQDSWVTAVTFHPGCAFIATGHDDGAINHWDAPGHNNALGTLRRHALPISALAISPDGKMLAAASEDRTISLWDLANGKHLGDLVGHTDRIPALLWHPSGSVLISAGWDTTARVWDVKTLQPRFLFNSHAAQVTALALSADGSLLACGDSELAVHVWDFTSKKSRHILKGPQTEIRTLAFSPDSARLASNGDRLIHLWDPTTGQALAGAGPTPVTKSSLALLGDGTRLVSNGGGSAVRVWDAAKQTILLSLPSTEPVHDVACSPDGRLIAGAARKTVRIWDAASGNVLADWDGPDEPITTLAFSPDGALLASASNTGEAVWLWRVADGEPVLLIPDALDGCAVEALAFHPNGKLLAVGGVDWLATGGTDGAISLWDIDQRCEVTTFFDGSTALAFDPTGAQLIASSLGQSVCFWDVPGQRLESEVVGHDGAVTAVACSPDGQQIASASADHTLRVWSSNGRELAAIEVESQITAIAFSRDGRFVYTAHANTTCGRIAVAEIVNPA